VARTSAWAPFWLLSAAVVGLGACSVPREVHEPLHYPEAKIAASTLDLQVSDARPPPRSASQRELTLPADFEATARARLSPLILGQGPKLGVQVAVAHAEAIEIVDARGEMTRVSVTFDFEVSVQGGPTLRRAETHSDSDLPRDEATPEELLFVLRATALDAFDRYWANPATEAALNKDLAAYGKRHPLTPGQEPAQLGSGGK
jgi:hypothetical protein